MAKPYPVQVTLVCPDCLQEIKVDVEMEILIKKDSLGQYMDIRPDPGGLNLTDIWAHVWTHSEEPGE